MRLLELPHCCSLVRLGRASSRDTRWRLGATRQHVSSPFKCPASRCLPRRHGMPSRETFCRHPHRTVFTPLHRGPRPVTLIGHVTSSSRCTMQCSPACQRQCHKLAACQPASTAIQPSMTGFPAPWAMAPQTLRLATPPLTQVEATAVETVCLGTPPLARLEATAVETVCLDTPPLTQPEFTTPETVCLDTPPLAQLEFTTPEMVCLNMPPLAQLEATALESLCLDTPPLAQLEASRTKLEICQPIAFLQALVRSGSDCLPAPRQEEAAGTRSRKAGQVFSPPTNIQGGRTKEPQQGPRQ